MDSDAPLDYALFQLSPRRSHCELFVCSNGKTEKIASGLVKPFVANLKVAEEQFARATHLIKLQVERPKKARTWFNKGTLERFVRFVSSPEVLEVVHTFDAEMSQLEGARRIYSQDADDQVPGSTGDNGKLASASRDATKKELLRAIDLRLDALNQDLTTACARATSAGFTLHTISELLRFANYFGAHRLNEACDKFSLLCQRRPDLSTQHSLQQKQQLCRGKNQAVGDGDIRSSSESDMSLDGPDDTLTSCSYNDNNKQNSLQSSSQHHKMPKSSTMESNLVDKEAMGLGESGQVKNLDASAPPSSAQPAGGSRRLSVQDRINLFESKQKEQASSTPTLAGNGRGSIGSRNVGRPELRRLSSDVSSSVEKSVLRRWSGASDMSIDLGSGNNSSNNKKENKIITTVPSDSSGAPYGFSNNPAGTKSEEKDTATSRPTVTMEETQQPILQHKLRSFSKDNDQDEDVLSKDGIDLRSSSRSLQVRSPVVQLNMDNTQLSCLQSQQASSSAALGDSGLEEQSSAQKNINTLPIQAKVVEPKTEAKSSGLKQVVLKEKERSYSARTSQNLAKEGHTDLGQDAHSSMTSSPTSAEVHGFNAQDSLSEIRASHSKEEIKSNRKSTFNSQVPLRISKTEIAQLKDTHLASQTSATLEEISTYSLSSAPDPSLLDLSGKVRKETRIKNTTRLERNLCKQSSESRRHQSNRDETSLPPQSLCLQVSGQKTESSTDTCDLVSASREPTQIAQSTKGNQELNNDLQIKADELEKLFAEHMLKVPGDLPSKRAKPVDVYPKFINKKTEDVLPNQFSERIVKDDVPDVIEFDAHKLFDIVNNQDYCFGAKFGDLSLPEDLRGKFYEQYMKKRDVKLREEWRSARASKEAKMKAMHERLEQSRAEMKVKFSGSADRHNSAMLMQRRAEKLRSISVSSAMKIKGQPIKMLQKEEEDVEDFADLIGRDQEQFTSGTATDVYSKGTLHKESSSNRSMSSTPRTSTISPSPEMEIRSVGSGRRKIQSENSLARSVPNFADSRKENAKPFSRTEKVTEKVVKRAQSRSSKYGKGVSESIATVREDRPHRSQSMRKESASPVELSDLSSVNSDNRIMEQTEQNSFQKVVESRPFLRKGKGIACGALAVVAKTKAPMVSQNIITEESQDFAGPEADSSNIIKYEEDYEEEAAEVASSMENYTTFSPESVHSDDRESGNGGASELQGDSSSLFAVISSELKFSGEAMQVSPGESPGSWNSRLHNSFSYAQEASDIDVSMDSPVGSPASWSFNSLNQLMDPDASRMRKKWGAAQKPMFVNSNVNQNHPKKDVTKGFKRLLKFGRKTKGVDALLPDWVSASTNSEGDEDPEDGRDSGYHMSDDMPKSRMGFSQYHSAYDGFNDGGTFNEEGHSLSTSIPVPPANFKLREDHLSGSSLKAPRSFFSLSTFRNKGSDSKLR